MSGHTPAATTVVPLAAWAALHPAALEAAAVRRDGAEPGGFPARRSRALARALAAANQRWGNPIDAVLERWLAGADVVVTGQQPGLGGGPLLTLVKACAVAAEVRRLRAAGRDAVGFLWLATADDDLPEMGWTRVAAADEIVAYRESGWERGACLGGLAPVGAGFELFLTGLAERFPTDHGREALALARRCFAPGALLGEATAQFLAALLRGLDIVLVDSLEPELARAAAPVTEAVLARLEEAWAALEAGSDAMRARGWTVPLRITPATLPLFRREGDRRRRVATGGGACPSAVLAEHAADPSGFLPNAWLRPIVQDAALGTRVALLGGAELAYHVQCAGMRERLGLDRPEWRLRPHVTVVTGAERRLAAQLDVRPDDLLHASRPGRTLPGNGVRRRTARLRLVSSRELDALAEVQRAELPALVGELDATRRKLDGALDWWEQRLDAAAQRADETNASRWRRLRAFVRPAGRPQERELSVLGAVAKLGVEWPALLAGVIDPCHPGMHLACWNEGGPW